MYYRVHADGVCAVGVMQSFKVHENHFKKENHQTAGVLYKTAVLHNIYAT